MNCLDGMKQIKDNSVDLILTDPPYGIDYQSSWKTDKTKRHKKIKNDKQPYIWWLLEANRILKDDGSLLCFCRWDTAESFKLAIEWAGFIIKSQVIWGREHHGMGDLKSSFAPQHDTIWFTTKGEFIFPNKRPKSIIRSKRLGGEQLTHPNEKPVDLIEQLILSTSEENDLIADFFGGSGSTYEACIKLKRNYIGFELDEKYFEIINNRIENIKIS